MVVAAPHGTSDPRTAEIAEEVARRTGFGLVIATGFALAPETPGGPARRYQVNRPLEGVPGRPPDQEVATEGARRVYQAYEGRVRDAAQGPVAFYAEIHGNIRQESAGRIEIATVGIDEGQARKLRALLELIRDAHLQGTPAAPRLEVLIEPADPGLGILRLPARALHVELPHAARQEWRHVYAAILAEFLREAVALRSSRGRP
jgi:hypothetical protein